MLRILKGIAVSCVIAGCSLLPIAPASAQIEDSAHCLPFVNDSLGCWVKCIVQNGTLKGCDEYAPYAIACPPDPVCDVLVEVWKLRP